MLDRNVSDITNLHEYAAEFVGKPISVFDAVTIAIAIVELNLLPAKLNIRKLNYEYGFQEDKYPDAKYFVIEKLKNAKDSEEIQPKDFVLYGFGRIGRLLAKESMLKTGKGT